MHVHALSITLLKRIKFTKQTCTKLDCNSKSSAAARSRSRKCRAASRNGYVVVVII